MDWLWSMQSRMFCTGEFNYQFDCDATRDKAIQAVVDHFIDNGATTVTATDDGIDLQGTVLEYGVDLSPGHVQLASDWYSGYLRIATNEKAVVRSYFSAGDRQHGQAIERKAREILAKQFHGRIVD